MNRNLRTAIRGRHATTCLALLLGGICSGCAGDQCSLREARFSISRSLGIADAKGGIIDCSAYRQWMADTQSANCQFAMCLISGRPNDSGAIDLSDANFIFLSAVGGHVRIAFNVAKSPQNDLNVRLPPEDNGEEWEFNLSSQEADLRIVKDIRELVGTPIDHCDSINHGVSSTIWDGELVQIFYLGNRDRSITAFGRNWISYDPQSKRSSGLPREAKKLVEIVQQIKNS